MPYRAVVLSAVFALVAVMPAIAAAEDPRWSLSTSVNYSVGDYGTGKDTTIVYVPFTLGVSPIDRLWLSLTVPFVYQNTQDVVLTGGGVASRKEEKGKLAKPAHSTTEEGLGDVLAKVSFTILREDVLLPEKIGGVGGVRVHVMASRDIRKRRVCAGDVGEQPALGKGRGNANV